MPANEYDCPDTATSDATRSNNYIETYTQESPSAKSFPVPTNKQQIEHKEHAILRQLNRVSWWKC